MKLKAVIFDKDGVLIDSEDAIMEAVSRTIKHFGGVGKYEILDRINHGGLPVGVTFKLLKKKHKLNSSINDMATYYNKLRFDLLKNKRPNLLEGVVALVDFLKKENIKIAIGTGSERKKTEIAFDPRFYNLFDAVVTAEDVLNGKPAPDTFLEAARRLNVLSSECVVIGDSHNDRIGAKRAGMKFVFRTMESFKIDDGMEPDIVVKSLTEFNVSDLENLFK